MWTRAKLKERAKVTFKMNYWRTVLVALIASIIMGGGGIGYNFDSSSFKNGFDMGMQGSQNSTASGDLNWVGMAAVIVASVIVVFLILFVIASILTIFVLNPLLIGTKRFFTLNLNRQANVRELGFAFDRSYLNTVKIMFFKDLYTFLWTLLFIIPGIVKSYEYRMIPYLLAEYPEMTKEQAFATSKQMMKGQKWKTFVLDLSFIGWYLLTIITLGIVEIFYFAPYRNMTYAALYDALKNQGNCPNGDGFNNQQGTDAYGNPQQFYYQNNQQ